MSRRRWIALLIVIALDASVLLYWRFRREHRFDDVIRSTARRYDLPPALVKAVAWQESRFDPEVRGAAGEIGLMQVMEDTALEWATAEKVPGFASGQLADPQTNLSAGAYYLAKLLRRYTNTNNALPYALADYNAGRGNVLRWLSGAARTNSAAFLEAVSFPSTRAYIDSVSRRYEHYRGEIP